VRAGVAAGAKVFAYVPASRCTWTPPPCVRPGAHHVFDDMALLPGLLGL